MRVTSSDIGRLSARLALSLTLAGLAVNAQAQQRGMSIDDWLRAERQNENLQQAYQAYDSTKFGTRAVVNRPVPAAQPVQTYQTNPMMQDPLAQTEPPQWPVASGELSQQQIQRNTYQVPPNAHERLDREIQLEKQASTAWRGIYLSGHVGTPLVPDQTYTDSAGTAEADFSYLTFYADAGIGYKFSNGIRLEVEGSYQYAPYAERYVDGDVSMIGILGNASMDIVRTDNFTLYLTGGLGLADHRISTSNSNIDGSDLVFAYQAGTGMTFAVTPRTSLDFGYRYFGTSDASINSSAGDYTAEYSAHIFMFGIDYKL